MRRYSNLDHEAPLTAEEIAAIDEAGAKGPPSQLVAARLAIQHKFERSSSLVMWLVIAIMFGFATFFMF
jgi:hypothetical protein